MITRRGFLKWGGVGAGALLLESFVFEPRFITVETVSVEINGLSPGLDGFTICQVSDVHHSPFVSLSYIEGVVEKASSLKPDLVVLTGDYIQGEKEYMAPAVKALSGIKSPRGTIAILGNHDYFTGVEYTRGVIASHGITLLENSHTIIEGKDGALCIAGTEDLLEGRPDAAASLEGVSTDVPRILLTHHPDYCEELPEGLRVDLALAGHTHGGQVRIPFSIAPVVPSRYGQKYSGGLVTLRRPGPPGPHGPTRVYVTKGVGVVDIPVRFNCPPELTLVRLRAKRSEA